MNNVLFWGGTTMSRDRVDFDKLGKDQTLVAMTQNQTDNVFRLDPKKFPKRIELEIPEEAVEKIQRIAASTGQSFSEVATRLLSRQVDLP